MNTEDKSHHVSILFGGQGSQEQEMFKKSSENPYSKNSTERMLYELRLIPGGSEVADVYLKNSEPHKVNNTKNAQVGLATYFSILFHSVEDKLGYKIDPDGGSGYSFGVIPALYVLDVLTLSDMLNISMLRGDAMNLIKPGQHYVMTITTKEKAHITRINWHILRKTGYKISIFIDDELVVLSGPMKNKAKVERRLENSGLVKAVVPIDHEKFYIAYHNGNEMRHYTPAFKHNLEMYCDAIKEERGKPVFRNLKDRRFFITNGGKILTKGKDIQNYISDEHIENRCEFHRTVRKVGSLTPHCIVIGPPNFKNTFRRYHEKGYTGNFFVISEPSDIDSAAIWYEDIMEKAERGLLPERVPQLRPAYN